MTNGCVQFSDCPVKHCLGKAESFQYKYEFELNIEKQHIHIKFCATHNGPLLLMHSFLLLKVQQTKQNPFYIAASCLSFPSLCSLVDTHTVYTLHSSAVVVVTSLYQFGLNWSLTFGALSWTLKVPNMSTSRKLFFNKSTKKNV